MRRIGIVDLGSNTARLVVYDYEPGHWFRLTDEIRELVRLGQGVASTGRLSQQAIDRAVAALRLYDEFARARHVDTLEIIATSAVREAENGREFLALVCDLGLDIRVLDGAEEARLGVSAVANSFALRDAWVMDLGGGSAQLSLMRDRKYVSGEAYPLGAVRLTEEFLPGATPEAKGRKGLEKRVRAVLRPALKQVRESGLPLVAMGGTIRNLAGAVQSEAGYPVDLMHNYALPAGSLDALTARLVKLKAEKRAAVPGIREDRADIILAGALVYRTVLREAALPELLVSREGLRQGEFYRHFLPSPHRLEDVRRFAVQNAFAHYPQPMDHTQQVRYLARRLFDALRPLHGYGAAEQRLLDEAATLHDIGMSVNYYDHHKHGAYLLQAVAMPGFTHREQILLGLLVRYHRKGTPGFNGFGALMQPGDDDVLRRLTACLRLGAYLERSRSGRVRDVEVDIAPKSVTLRLIATADPSVERWEATRQTELFESAFGRRLLIAG